MIQAARVKAFAPAVHVHAPRRARCSGICPANRPAESICVSITAGTPMPALPTPCAKDGGEIKPQRSCSAAACTNIAGARWVPQVFPSGAMPVFEMRRVRAGTFAQAAPASARSCRPAVGVARGDHSLLSFWHIRKPIEVRKWSRALLRSRPPLLTTQVLIHTGHRN